MGRIALYAAFCTALLSACTGNHESNSVPVSAVPTPRPSEVVLSPAASPNLQDLVQSVRKVGVLVRSVTRLSESFFAVPGHSLSLSARQAIEVFEYPTSQAAARDAARVSRDGYSLDPAVGLPAVQVEWVSPPHFFLQGRTMVVYLGGRRAVLDWLRGTFGDQFAGA